MTDPLSVQYAAFNQRRLHYSLLFWSCLALEFSGAAILLILQVPEKLLILGGISCLLMAFIAHRLYRQEEHYTQSLRNIDAAWAKSGISAIQSDLPISRFGSRRLVILALAGLGLFLLGDVYLI